MSNNKPILRKFCTPEIILMHFSISILFGFTFFMINKTLDYKVNWYLDRNFANPWYIYCLIILGTVLLAHLGLTIFYTFFIEAIL